MKKLLLIMLVALTAMVICFASGAKEGSTSPAKTGEVKYKEHIVYGTANACPSLDFYKTATGSSEMVFRAAKERLVYYNPDTQLFEPELATSWDWNDTVITFQLREGVKWSNGEPFTAADVVYTFNHLAELDATYKEKIKSVEAKGDYTVVMTLNSYDADWFYTLTSGRSSISNKKAMEESNDTTVTTGPWIITGFAADDYVEMVRNENYWGELPKTKKLTFKTITENSARLVALQSGDIDVCQGPAAVDLDIIEDDPNLRLDVGDCSKTIYICFNTTKFPFNDVNFRKAVELAIDRQEIVDIVRDGHAIVGASTWGPATFGFDSSIKAPEQNIELAKEYLKKVYPDGKCSVEIAVRQGDWAPIATVLQEQLRKIGIEVTINVMQNAAFTEYCGTEQHQIGISGCAWPVAAGAWASKLYSVLGNPNRSRVQDPEIIDLISRADSGKDQAERAELYKKVQAINEEKVYYITVFYEGTMTAMNKNLEGGRFDLPEKEVKYICIPE